MNTVYSADLRFTTYCLNTIIRAHLHTLIYAVICGAYAELHQQTLKMSPREEGSVLIE